MPDSAPFLDVEALQVSYGAIKAVRDISFHVQRGEIVTLLGANGAGKSSTMNALVGLVPRRAGKLHFGGQDIASLSTEMIVRRGLTLVPEGRRIFPSLSVAEHLLLGGAKHASRGDLAATREQMLTMFPILKERLHQKAGSLSGGEQQMLAIARALMSSPDLLLLDEPSLGLAPQVVERIFTLLADLRAKGLTVLLVEQNAALALDLADRGYVLASGHIEVSGTAAELKNSSEIRDAYLGA